MDPRGTGFGLAFIIFAVAAGAAMPGIGAFHHPALWERDKASSTSWAFLHFDPPSGPMLCEPRVQGMIVILAIAKDDGEPRELVGADLGEEFDGGGPIIERGARDQDDEQQPDRVNQHRAFAPANSLAPIIPPLRASHFRRLDRLTVDAGGTGSRLAPFLDAYACAQEADDLGPRAVIPPLRKVVVDRALGEQIMRSHIPLTPGPILIQQRVEHSAHVHPARGTAVLGAWGGQPRLQNHPLFVGQV